MLGLLCVSTVFLQLRRLDTERAEIGMLKAMGMSDFLLLRIMFCWRPGQLPASEQSQGW